VEVRAGAGEELLLLVEFGELMPEACFWPLL